MNSPAPQEPLPESFARHIDRVCDQFEAELRVGRHPRPEAFLESCPEPARQALHLELRRAGRPLPRSLGWGGDDRLDRRSASWIALPDRPALCLAARHRQRRHGSGVSAPRPTDGTTCRGERTPLRASGQPGRRRRGFRKEASDGPPVSSGYRAGLRTGCSSGRWPHVLHHASRRGRDPDE